LLAFSATGWAAERTYQITETELTRLEANLTRQEAALLKALDLQEVQEQELSALKGQLQTALSELRQSKEQVESLKESLNTVLYSIESANQSFEKYAKEMKSRLRAAKRQRNGWAAGFVAAVFWAAGK
jgi:peptidoglycan hydrolase CwlO-like protein